jgi:hypothetical protein
MIFIGAENKENINQPSSEALCPPRFLQKKSMRSPIPEFESKFKNVSATLPNDTSPFTESEDSTRNSQFLSSSAFGLEQSLPLKSVTCSCKSSQCLKLYCECFAAGAYCDPAVCSCMNCSNNIQNEVSQIIYSNINF